LVTSQCDTKETRWEITQQNGLTKAWKIAKFLEVLNNAKTQCCCFPNSRVKARARLKEKTKLLWPALPQSMERQKKHNQTAV